MWHGRNDPDSSELGPIAPRVSPPKKETIRTRLVLRSRVAPVKPEAGRLTNPSVSPAMDFPEYHWG